MDLATQAQNLASDLSNNTPIIYILRLKSGSLYIGCTTDYQARFQEHEKGTACRTTSCDQADYVEHIEAFSDLKSARQRESQLKRWSRAKKEALISQQIDLLKKLSKSHSS